MFKIFKVRSKIQHELFFSHRDQIQALALKLQALSHSLANLLWKLSEGQKTSFGGYKPPHSLELALKFCI